MLESTRRALLEAIGPDDVVLDIGGWADPFPRADWVMDMFPFETRGMYEQRGWVEPRPRADERFSKETWIERDICSREPYPFEDGEIDFVICSQTLEDVRDPVFVCSEMNRIAKAGYLEVPSRLDEQSWGVNGPFVGWSHHHWICDVGEGRIDFVFKLHAIHTRPDQYFSKAFHDRLSAEERVQSLWWEGEFGYGERTFFSDEADGDRYLADLVERELAARPGAGAGIGERARTGLWRIAARAERRLRAGHT